MLIFKRLLDIVISILCILALFPVFLVIALFIKIGSDGPVFFMQDRLGRDCIVFKMIKFRTMVVDAECMGTKLFSFKDDPRVTRVGYFLRRTSLDELPQLFNVLQGDMSLVGPRPPVVNELGPINEFDLKTRARFRFKPGITGLAQISGRNSLSWSEKIKFDNEYIELFLKKGFVVDLLIIFKTLIIVLSMKNTIEGEK